MDVKESHKFFLNNDKVSIIMPTYNSSNYISKTIESILIQTYFNWELLITDDASTDNTVDIIHKYINLDKRIYLFRFNKNIGAYAARNNSLNYTQGRYMAFCDSDDIWKFDKLAKQLNFLKIKNIGFTFSSYTQIFNNKIIGYVKPPKILTYTRLLKFCEIGTSTVIYDTKIINKIYFPSFKRRHDYALWLLIFKSIKKAYSMNEILVDYNFRDNSLSSNKFKSAFYHFYVLKKITNYNFLFLLYNFTFYILRGFYIHKIIKFHSTYLKSNF